MRLSAVIPVLDEVGVISATVIRLRQECDEVVVVDGGSMDGTPEAARAAGAVVVASERGRGRQLDAGATAATGDVLWFVHADTGIPPGAGSAIRDAATRTAWGCFAVRVESEDPRLRWCGRYMTRRARRTGSATGDMAIWCTRALFQQAGGFGEGAICEDLAFCDRARREGPWAVLPLRVGTSARRWEAEGVTRTMLRMWAVRGAFRAGLPVKVIAPIYRSKPR